MSGLVIAGALFSGATAAASLGGGVTGFLKVKTHNDPVRQGLKWISPALISLFLGTLLYFVQSILSLTTFDGYFGFGSGYTARSVGIMATFFVHLAMIGMFFTLLQTSFGILEMWNRAPRRIAGMRTTAWVVVSIMLALDLAYMIGSYVGFGGIFGIISFTLECVHLAAMCWVLGMMILVAKRAKAHRNGEGLQGGQNVLSLYYGSVSVALFGAIWFLIDIIVVITVRPTFGRSVYDTTVIMSFVVAFIGFLVPLVSLILLIVLGIRQQGGLWTVGSAAPRKMDNEQAASQ